MIEIIPAILEKDFSEIAAKIKRIEQEAPDIKWAQIDVMDGEFVPNTTWSNPEDINKLKTDLLFEVHFMVASPKTVVSKWLDINKVKRILVHFESFRDEAELLDLCMMVKEGTQEFGVVLNPETPLERVIDHIIVLDEVMFMAVSPGFGGQSFQESVLNKIRELRALDPRIPIGVDGGVNAETAPSLISAGATHLCVNSYLWKASNLQEAIDSLKMTVIEVKG